MIFGKKHAIICVYHLFFVILHALFRNNSKKLCIERLSSFLY